MKNNELENEELANINIINDAQRQNSNDIILAKQYTQCNC